MKTKALSPAQVAFVAAWHAKHAPSPPELTLADLDEAQDFEPLHERVRQACGSYCKWIDFYDDNASRGGRTLYYRVCVPLRAESRGGEP